jgi:2-dehydro-3-deoxy-D-arabinonate dehydratase
MSAALYRIGMSNGLSRLAVGSPGTGPEKLLPDDLSISALLALTASDFWELVDQADTWEVSEPARVLAPIEGQPVWASGVTYRPSRDARKEEARNHGSVYDSVFEAVRPELFYKAHGSEVRGPGVEINIRSDSTWDVPEPELTLVLTSACEPVAVTIGNDVSSRSIEGANPLYLPQAKAYEGSCALGPCLVPFEESTDRDIELTIQRGNATVFHGRANTSAMVRPLRELAGWLARGRIYPDGVFLLTGTGIVPPQSFTLSKGDLVVIRIEGIGELANLVSVIDCGPPPPDEGAHVES